jgi:long-chain acyl-CoA synthetase
MVSNPAAARTIPEMLRAACARFDGKLAFQARVGDGLYARASFAEVCARAESFAGALRQNGLHTGDRVGIACENRLEWPIAYYGIVLTGGVAVPIYAALPGEETRSLLARVGARFLVASVDVLDRLPASIASVEQTFLVGAADTERCIRPDRGPGCQGHVVPFERVSRREPVGQTQGHPEGVVDPESLAQIVFTSGTTGGPKGVMLTHRNVMASLNSMALTMPVGSKDRLLLTLPLHHVFPLSAGVLLAVAIGAEVTLESDPGRVRQLLRETRPTVLFGVPALFEIMYRSIHRRAERTGRASEFNRATAIARAVRAATGLNVGRLLFRAVHQELGGALRFMISGGAPLDPETARQFMFLGLPLLQGYGLTETAPVTVQRWSTRRFYFTRHFEQRLGSVGQPLPGVEMRLIDVPERNLFVETDGEGELVVRGPTVTKGYWEAPEATRDAFDGEWFKTGDLARIDREGNIWITGRRKYVIVLDSGEKVHPDRVEAALSRSALIEDVCIVPLSLRGRTHVCAVIYPSVQPTLDALRHEGLPLTEAGVRGAIVKEVDRVQGGVATYERPSVITLAASPLPKTPIGKVARERLEEHYEFSFKAWLASAGDTRDDAAAP